MELIKEKRNLISLIETGDYSYEIPTGIPEYFGQ